MTSLLLHICLYIALVSLGGFIGLWLAFAHQSETTGTSVALDERHADKQVKRAA